MVRYREAVFRRGSGVSRCRRTVRRNHHCRREVGIRQRDAAAPRRQRRRRPFLRGSSRDSRARLGTVRGHPAPGAGHTGRGGRCAVHRRRAVRHLSITAAGLERTGCRHNTIERCSTGSAACARASRRRPGQVHCVARGGSLGSRTPAGGPDRTGLGADPNRSRTNEIRGDRAGLLEFASRIQCQEPRQIYRTTNDRAHATSNRPTRICERPVRRSTRATPSRPWISSPRPGRT